MAAGGWRCMPGMLGMNGKRLRVVYGEYEGGALYGTLGFVPDFRDPATVGCLFALVREKWGPSAHCRMDDGLWVVIARGEEYGQREAGCGGFNDVEALVSALRDAPK